MSNYILWKKYIIMEDLMNCNFDKNRNINEDEKRKIIRDFLEGNDILVLINHKEKDLRCIKDKKRKKEILDRVALINEIRENIINNYFKGITGDEENLTINESGLKLILALYIESLDKEIEEMIRVHKVLKVKFGLEKVIYSVNHNKELTVEDLIKRYKEYVSIYSSYLAQVIEYKKNLTIAKRNKIQYVFNIIVSIATVVSMFTGIVALYFQSK